MSWVEIEENTDSKRPANQGDRQSQTAHCSLCGHPFDRRNSKVFPFCSVRCQQIDLGQWLEEKHGLPLDGQEDQEFSGHES